MNFLSVSRATGRPREAGSASSEIVLLVFAPFLLGGRSTSDESEAAWPARPYSARSLRRSYGDEGLCSSSGDGCGSSFFLSRRNLAKKPPRCSLALPGASRLGCLAPLSMGRGLLPCLPLTASSPSGLANALSFCGALARPPLYGLRVPP